MPLQVLVGQLKELVVADENARALLPANQQPEVRTSVPTCCQDPKGFLLGEGTEFASFALACGWVILRMARTVLPGASCPGRLELESTQVSRVSIGLRWPRCAGTTR